jgi:hypothetical protein
MAILGYSKFDLPKWLEQRRLAGWLEIATADLEASAKQRITQEIEAHYGEALKSHVEAGEHEYSAQDSALADLGDPRVAATNFKKTYLTGSEAEWLQAWERSARTPLFSASMLWWNIMALGALALLYPPSPWYVNSRYLALMALLTFAVYRLIPRLFCASIAPRIKFLKALALLSFLAGMAPGLAFGLAIISNRDQSRVFFDILTIFNAAFLFYFWGFYRNTGWRIWNKLRKTVATPEPRDATPPNQIIST